MTEAGPARAGVPASQADRRHRVRSSAAEVWNGPSGLWQLTAIGIGGIIGAGIFSLAGAVANEKAGPAVVSRS